MINNETNSKQLIAKSFFELARYDEAFELFYNLNHYYEAGLCKLLMGDIAEAKRLFTLELRDTPALEWAKILVQLISSEEPEFIPFFQIRNYLERDINLLIKAKLLPFVENIINFVYLLARYNPESYKFIGRVLINNGYYEMAKDYLNSSLNICYADPETHLLLAKYWQMSKNKDNASKSAKNAIKVCPGYFPAEQFLKELSSL